MTILQGFFLGILQGIAEFLPISSSGHLEIAQYLFGLDDIPIIFDLFLHMATLLAVCIYFWDKIWRLLCCLGRWITKKEEPSVIYKKSEYDILCNTDEQGRKTIIAILISTIITGIFGILIDEILNKISIHIICINFLITAVLLIISSIMQSRKSYRENNAHLENFTHTISAKDAVITGVMQGFGTLPGISRSGSTIAGAIFSGLDRKTAGDYSFIISIPAILGAFILELKDLSKMTQSIPALPIIIGCITAFVTGYLCLATLMKIIRKGKLHYFSIYLILIGLLGLKFL